MGKHGPNAKPNKRQRAVRRQQRQTDPRLPFTVLENDALSNVICPEVATQLQIMISLALVDLRPENLPAGPIGDNNVRAITDTEVILHFGADIECRVPLTHFTWNVPMRRSVLAWLTQIHDENQQTVAAVSISVHAAGMWSGIMSYTHVQAFTVAIEMAKQHLANFTNASVMWATSRPALVAIAVNCLFGERVAISAQQLMEAVSPPSHVSRAITILATTFANLEALGLFAYNEETDRLVGLRLVSRIGENALENLRLNQPNPIPPTRLI